MFIFKVINHNIDYHFNIKHGMTRKMDAVMQEDTETVIEVDTKRTQMRTNVNPSLFNKDPLMCITNICGKRAHEQKNKVDRSSLTFVERFSVR